MNHTHDASRPFHTIVIGTDGSADSQVVVDAGGQLALASGSDAVHVVTGYRPLGELELAQLAHDLPDEFRTGLWSDQSGDVIVADACLRLRALGVESTGHPIPAKGADAVLQVATEVGADLIVVGSDPHGPFGRILHRSVSTAVTQHAPCSVLVVRPPQEPDS